MLESYIRAHLEQIAINTGRIADALEVQIKNIAKHERLHAETKIRNTINEIRNIAEHEQLPLDETKLQNTIDKLKQSLVDEGLAND